MVKSFLSLDSITDKITENTDKYTNSLFELGMTDEEIETKNIEEFYDKVSNFGLGIDLGAEDFGLTGFMASFFNLISETHGLEAAVDSFGLTMKDTAFNANMSVSEIIAFTQSLIDSGVNIDDSIEDIYNWANSIQDAEVDLEDVTEEVEAFSSNMKELYYTLKGETEVDNAIRQIKEVYNEFGIVGNYTSITSDELADFVRALDSTDSETRKAEASITKLANSIMNLERRKAKTL